MCSLILTDLSVQAEDIFGDCQQKQGISKIWARFRKISVDGCEKKSGRWKSKLPQK